MTRLVTIALIALLPLPVLADLRVFACEPEWAALAREIGQGHVDTYSATHALQDPHYIQARPSLIARVRRADLLICSGAGLEAGWLPVLLGKANNRRVMPGAPGFMEASSLVTRLEVTGNIDRAAGDVHPQGNPHIQTNPHNILSVAVALGERMAQLDPDNSAAYRSALVDFSDRWNKAMQGWESKGAILKGKRAITHHKSWVYLEDWLGIEDVANLEPVPGLPPTVTHLSRLLSEFGDGGADFIIRAPFQDAKPSQWLSQRTGIAAVVLPLTVGGTDQAGDLFELFDDIINRLVGTLP